MAEDVGLGLAPQRVGRTLRDKWRLQRLLGTGGMAAVYAATHRNGKRAAVKVLHAEHAQKPELRTRFLREGYVANAVDHPGAVSVLDDDVDGDGCPFLVMELLEGETLEARWERKGQKLAPAEVLSVADKLLDVLAAAHAKGIVHRDIKPENVFLTRDGVIKVLDFGIARLLERSSLASTTTRAGAAMGTPAFMPPEQAAGDWDAVDARTDLWAVGAMMFTLISGRFVHHGRNLNEQLVTSATQPAPPLRSVAPWVSKEVASVVDRAVAFRKEQRYSDAVAMQRAVREAYWVEREAPDGEEPSAWPVEHALSGHVPVGRVASEEVAALAANEPLGDTDEDATIVQADTPELLRELRGQRPLPAPASVPPPPTGSVRSPARASASAAGGAPASGPRVQGARRDDPLPRPSPMPASGSTPPALRGLAEVLEDEDGEEVAVFRVERGADGHRDPRSLRQVGLLRESESTGESGGGRLPAQQGHRSGALHGHPRRSAPRAARRPSRRALVVSLSAVAAVLVASLAIVALRGRPGARSAGASPSASGSVRGSAGAVSESPSR
jgi:serine/threonine-protein kinase